MSGSPTCRWRDDDVPGRSTDAGGPGPWDASWLDDRSGKPPRLWRMLWIVSLVGLVLVLVGWLFQAMLGGGK